jgi:RNA polymerase sigma-70 factor (ECF subfamily)
MDSEGRSFDVIGQLGALRRYARSLARNSQDAEDLVHDALVKAYERRLTFRTGANLKNWLFAILHNTHIDGRRAAMAQKRRDDAALAETEQAQAPGQDHVVHLSQVRDAFMALPQDQREALHLVAVEDLSYQGAADALGIPVGTLMSRVSRARARLRALDEDSTRRPGHLRLVGGDDD